jgi:hypothetical protein
VQIKTVALANAVDALIFERNGELVFFEICRIIERVKRVVGESCEVDLHAACSFSNCMFPELKQGEKRVTLIATGRRNLIRCWSPAISNAVLLAGLMGDLPRR